MERRIDNLERKLTGVENELTNIKLNGIHSKILLLIPKIKLYYKLVVTPVSYTEFSLTQCFITIYIILNRCYFYNVI